MFFIAKISSLLTADDRLIVKNITKVERISVLNLKGKWKWHEQKSRPLDIDKSLKIIPNIGLEF